MAGSNSQYLKGKVVSKSDGRVRILLDRPYSLKDRKYELSEFSISENNFRASLGKYIRDLGRGVVEVNSSYVKGVALRHTGVNPNGSSGEGLDNLLTDEEREAITSFRSKKETD